MPVRPIQNVNIADPHQIMGKVLQPQWCKSYGYAELGLVNQYESGGFDSHWQLDSSKPGFYCDPHLGLVYADPVYVMSDNVTEGIYGETGITRQVTWDNYVCRNSNIQLIPRSPHNKKWLHIARNPDGNTEPGIVVMSGTGYGYAEVGDTQGCRLYYMASSRVRGGGTGESTYTEPMAIDFNWLVGNNYHVGVYMATGRIPRVALVRSDTGKIIRSVTLKEKAASWDHQAADNTQKLVSQQGAELYVPRDGEEAAPYDYAFPVSIHSIDVLVIANRVKVTLDGVTEPIIFVLPDDAAEDPVITGYGYHYEGGAYLGMSWNPIWFAGGGWVWTNEENTGFDIQVADNDWSFAYDFVYMPIANGIPTWTAGVTNIYKSLQMYRMLFKMIPSYAYLEQDSFDLVDEERWWITPQTPVLKQVTANIPSILQAPSSVVSWESLSHRANKDYVRQISVERKFDIDTLNMYSNATVGLSNRHGEWADAGGMCAMKVDMGWENPDYYFRAFTGYGGIKHNYERAQAPESLYYISGEDLSYQLRSSDILVLPWMDGWCHYYAIRFICQMAGINPEWLQYACDPDTGPCLSPDCGHNHYFLPMGDGGSPLMRFQPGTPYWTVIQRIQKLVGYVAYFDNSGYLRYYPWVRTAPGSWVADFIEGWDSNNNMRMLQQVSLVRDMDTVRNSVSIMGVDAFAPMWKPIIGNLTDEDSINTYGSRNYVGFQKRMCIADSMFANMDYLNLALANYYNVARLPCEEVTFTCLGQPDIAPLDVIRVLESHTGAGEYRGEYPRFFFVTNTKHFMVADKNNQMHYNSTITGRWIV